MHSTPDEKNAASSADNVIEFLSFHKALKKISKLYTQNIITDLIRDGNYEPLKKSNVTKKI